MSNSYFRFKQFIVHHDQCAMKVGTDGVLLGAWADVEEKKNILDVGSGSGLIALMAAQRNDKAQVTAIDIDEDSCLQAKKNVALSSFANRIRVQKSSFQNFVQQYAGQFDLIISNPPFFNRSLLSPDALRSQARHSDTLSLDELLRDSKKIISPEGKLSIIYPFEEKSFWENVITKHGWFIHRQTNIFPKQDSICPKRVLLELALFPSQNVYTELVIEVERHMYSTEFIALVKDFYLYL